MTPQNLIPDPEIDDWALDYAEERLGRFYFKMNWDRLQRRGGALSSVQSWMREKGLPDSRAQEVVYHLDTMAKQNAKWTS